MRLRIAGGVWLRLPLEYLGKNGEIVMGLVLDLLKENWLTLVIAVALVSAAVLLRTTATDLASTEEFDQRVQSGLPVVVEFYTNT